VSTEPRETSTDESRLPIDPRNGRHLPPREQPGFYPGFSTLDQKDWWDAATRDVVLDRVDNVPPIRFFNSDEAALLDAVCECVLPQADRVAERRIPLVNYVDERLAKHMINGYRFEDMPPDEEAMRLGLAGIDRMATDTYGRHFLDLTFPEQEILLKSIHDGEPKGGGDIWQRLPTGRFWPVLLAAIVEAYYSHPWAWDEIGFGGPAYPRGYMRIARGMPEYWECDEQRYEWDAPPDSISGKYEPVGGPHSGHPPPGQAGTH
jgi:hypothetical protein